jgi:alkanesulfonate monooxygenase SsuD/methylene tetrahydromethanopterin reductase-like flavin-dependent oxidoreductase (luciferase family)
MRSFEIGVVLPIMQFGPDRVTPRWPELRAMALRAEEIGFDTLWTPDELLWLAAEGPPRGVWDGVSMAGAVAATTSRITVGTWVMSALHRNPGIIAKTVETLDEISGGRFLFGLGAGHEWPGQAHAFGLPEDHIFGRFDDALQIIVPLLARRPRRLRGHLACGARPAPAAGWAATEPHPHPDRRKRSEGATPRRAPCGHLQLLCGGARPHRRARAAARVAGRDLRRDRSRSRDGRPLRGRACKRGRTLAGSSRRHLRFGGGDRGRPPIAA